MCVLDGADGRLVSPKTEAALRVHAFEIVQNLLADTAALEIHKTYENAGEQALLDSLQDAVQYGTDDLRKAVRTPLFRRVRAILTAGPVYRVKSRHW